MNGLIVDLFCGGGGASTGLEAALGRRVDIAINHSPTAIAVHEANHPNTRHLTTDVFEVDPRKATRGRRVDVLWASPDCFAAGTLILTRQGMVPVESVALGEEVLTHRGRWRRVVDLISKDADTVIVRGHGHFGIVTTADHQFYSKRITTRYPGKVGANGRRPGPKRTLVENPYWPNAADMAGKLWATPRAFGDAAIPTCSGAEFSSDFFYFIGRWVGDGSLNKGDVEICCGKNEESEFEAWLLAHPLKRAGGEVVQFRKVDRGSTVAFVWGNAPLGRWLLENCGTYSERKQLPVWALSMQRDWRESLLRGYVDADGHNGPPKQTSSVSKALSVGIRLLAVSLGYAATLYRAAGRHGSIDGREFEGRDIFGVHWREELQRQTVWWDALHMFSPVREVRETGLRQRVFCLSIEEDESFVADGIVVHNCTHFSRAKAGVPKSKKIRSLAHVVVEWARAVRPSVIFVENVEEFTTWGPLGENGMPIKERAGESYRYWRASLELLGYQVDARALDSSKYGAPTKRKRFFVVARCDGAPIVWPAPTHGPGLEPYRSTAEGVIDWSLPCPSIFGRKKPLVEKTLKRIAEGLRRYVVGNPDPYIVRVGGSDALPALAGGQKQALVSAFVSRYFNGPKAPVGKDVREPLPTITATDHNAVAAVTLAKFRGTADNQPGSHDIRLPLPTISAGGIHVAQVVAFLEAHGLHEPAVIVGGQPFRIVDIGLRMLQPHELLRAQFGRFAAGYDLSAAKTKEAQIRLIGNSVSPETAEALVAANIRAERAVAA